MPYLGISKIILLNVVNLYLKSVFPLYLNFSHLDKVNVDYNGFWKMICNDVNKFNYFIFIYLRGASH